MPDRVGQLFGNYRLVRLLGRGGFADVYLGQHQRLSAQVAAIKILDERLSAEDGRVFEREAQTVASLVHPHIVRLLDYDLTNEGTPFLVMDYAPKGSMRQRHQKGERVPLPVVVSYVNQIAEALQYAHDKKIIHRDVKPDNMLIGVRNEIVLSDFGIAANAHSTGSQSVQASFGTVSYMAPEQIQEYPRPASDQYALAVTVYEWLTGERPFQGSITEIVSKHMMMSPPPLRSKLPGLAPAVEQVVLRALAKEPHKRFPSVIDFAHALEDASRGIATVMPTPQPAQPPIGSPSAPLRPEVFADERRLADADDNPTELIISKSPPVPYRVPTPYTPVSNVSGSSYEDAPTLMSQPPVYSQPISSPPPPVVKPRRRWRLSLVVPLALVSLLLIAGIIAIPLVRVGWFGLGAHQGNDSAAQANATASAIAGTVISANGGQVVTIKLAADLPLVGIHGAAGQQIENAIRIAIDDANTSNFLPGYNLTLDSQNDSGDPEIGKHNISTWISDAEVAGIIGPLDSDVAMSEMPITNRAPLAQISPSTTYPCLTQNAPTTICTGTNNLLPTLRPTGKVTYFRLLTTDDQEGAASADYAFKTLHYKTAFLIDDTLSYGLGLAKTFTQRFQADGGTILGHDSIASTNDYNQELTKIADLKPDVLFFAGHDSTGGITLRQQMLSTQGLQSTPFQGGDGIRTNAFASAIGITGVPTYAAVVNVDTARLPKNTRFVNQYQARYGPITGSSAIGYDCAEILLNAIKAAIQAGTRPPLNSGASSAASIFRQAVIDQIARTSYDGMTGHQGFDTNGDSTNKTLTIYRLTKVSDKPGWKYTNSETL
jgi:branched-chain amino acid transport system substrate-binding protein